MRIALVSDLHANAVALDAVLAHVAEAGVDRIVCLGDVATLGPSPREVVHRLRELGCPCIQGNHDAFLGSPGLVHAYTRAPEVVRAIDWARDRLRRDELDFVAGFRPSMEVELARGVTLLLVHGSPRSNTEELLATTPPDELEARLAGSGAAVIASGHTHVQMLRQHRGTLLVNPGSVGMPFAEHVSGRRPTILAHAEYAIVGASPRGVEVALHRVPLDRAALRDAARHTDNPIGRSLVEAYAA